MCISVRFATAAAMGVVALGVVGISVATAADLPYSPPQVQSPPPNYNPGPPHDERYAYPPREGYAYPPPPETYAYPPEAYPYPPPPVVYRYSPPVQYYAYAPAPEVIVPRPYYWGRPVRGWGYGPFIARGYGRFDHPFGHRGW
jgi:hypothetical protein